MPSGPGPHVFRVDTKTPAPPVLIYLPPLAVKTSTGPAIADMIALRLTQGPGTFRASAVQTADTSTLEDGRRITGAQGAPVLDVYTYNYLPRLSRLTDRGAEAKPAALVLRFLRQLRYFLRAVLLFRGAVRRAKGIRAVLQLLYGFVLVIALSVTVAAALYAVVELVLSALSSSWHLFWDVPDEFDTALAAGLGAAVLWLLLRGRTVANSLAEFLAQTMDYLQDPRHGATVCSGLISALDSLLEDDPDREIHILAYSFGSLLAVDTLFPKKSLLTTADPRYARTVRSLATVGCPVDFVRLYQRDYLEARTALVPKLKWTNIFIAADVMGSNFRDRARRDPDGVTITDFTEEQPSEASTGFQIDDEIRTSSRYTDQRLTAWGILANRGFTLHGGYWGSPGEANCLDKVIAGLGISRVGHGSGQDPVMPELVPNGRWN